MHELNIRASPGFVSALPQFTGEERLGCSCGGEVRTRRSASEGLRFCLSSVTKPLRRRLNLRTPHSSERLGIKLNPPYAESHSIIRAPATGADILSPPN
ncbi:unnamed protein product [Leuciscus chuanchicus]